MSAPAFTPQDRVEYRWSGAGPFVGEARVVEVLPDGRYRVERLDGTPLPKESSIFSEEQLRLKPPDPVGSDRPRSMAVQDGLAVPMRRSALRF